MDDRYFVVIIRDQDGSMTGLSRRMAGPAGRSFAGPWGALTQDEADELAELWNADPREGGTAETVELFRYDSDPAWPNP